MESTSVTSPDGVAIATYESGNPDGAELLFLHGICQSHLAWQPQMADPALAAQFRMVAIDLRGHGASGKPLDRAAYVEDARWAGDIAAVIAARRLKRPVLVAWSYAGRVVTDYLRTHGTHGVAGINFVDAQTRTDPAASGAERKHLLAMPSEDLSTCIAATRGFLRGCFARQPAQEAFEIALAYNMLVPAKVRGFMLDRTANPGDVLPRIDVPVLVTHGALDAIILARMSEQAAAEIPGATLSLYPDAGHCPFAEDTARFNRELTDFARGLIRGA